MEKKINHHICHQNKEESKIITYRNKKYHEICLLSAYPYKEVMSKQKIQGEEGLVKINRGFMWKYFGKHGSLEGFDAFVSDFVEMSEWLIKNREASFLNAKQKFRQ